MAMRPRAYTDPELYLHRPPISDNSPITTVARLEQEFSGKPLSKDAMDILEQTLKHLKATREAPAALTDRASIEQSAQDSRVGIIIRTNILYMRRVKKLHGDRDIYMPLDFTAGVFLLASNPSTNRRIGNSFCGLLTRVRYPSGEKLAFKKPNDLPLAQTFQDTECTIFFSLPPHPNVISFLGIIQEPYKESLCNTIALEYAELGDLVDSFDDLNRTSPILNLRIACELAAALTHLHKHRVLYRDMKAENIVLDRDFHVKLIDFGSSMVLSPQIAADFMERKSIFLKRAGTPIYWPPEFFTRLSQNSSAPHSFKTDTWAYGCILSELLDPNHKHIIWRLYQNATPAYQDLPAAAVSQESPTVSAHERFEQLPYLEKIKIFSHFFLTQSPRLQDNLNQCVDAMVEESRPRLGSVALHLGDIIKACLVVDSKKRPLMYQVCESVHSIASSEEFSTQLRELTITD